MEVIESGCEVPFQRRAAPRAGAGLVGDGLCASAVTSRVKRTKRRPSVGSWPLLRSRPGHRGDPGVVPGGVQPPVGRHHAASQRTLPSSRHWGAKQEEGA